jgi:hypothetical protein
MTYGWAILAVLIVFGALAYFMPQTKSLTNNKCIFSPATPCLGVRLTTENLTVVLRNGIGQTMYNISANMTAPINNDCKLSNTTLVAEGRLTITCNNIVVKVAPNSRVKMSVTYKKVKNGYNQISIGDIYAK